MLAYVVCNVVLHKAVKVNFSKPTSKVEKWAILILRVIFDRPQLQCTAEFVSKALKDFFFALTVFITAENMSCIHI